MKDTAPRDEIWFRKIYAAVIEQQRVTTIFRPGKREANDPKGFLLGETLRIRILDSVGADWAGVIGRVYPDIETRVRVRSIAVKKIGELTSEDFVGSTPDVHDVQSLIYNLGILYNLSPQELTADALVTITAFEYL